MNVTFSPIIFVSWPWPKSKLRIFDEKLERLCYRRFDYKKIGLLGAGGATVAAVNLPTAANSDDDEEEVEVDHVSLYISTQIFARVHILYKYICTSTFVQVH